MGLWIEYVWAWWAGAALTSFVVVMNLALGILDGGLVLWSVFLALFVASAVQGWRGRTSQR